MKYILIFIFPFLLQAQDSDLVVEQDWEISTGIQYPFQSFLLSMDEGRGDISASEKRLQFYPTPQPEIDLNLRYKIVSFFYRFELPQDDNEIILNKNLSSKVDSYKLELAWKNWRFRSYYQKVEGYNLDLDDSSGFNFAASSGLRESASLVAPEQEIKIIPRPDMKSEDWLFGTAYHYHFLGINSKSEAVLNPTEKSFLDFVMKTQAAIKSFKIWGGAPFVPAQSRDEFSEISLVSGISNQGLDLKWGIETDWRFASAWSFRFGFNAGIGLYNQTISTPSLVESKVTTSEVLDFNFGLYFEGKNHGFASSIFIDNTSTKIEQANLDSTLILLSAQYAYRF